MIAGTTPQDVTRDVLANGGDIRRSAFAKGESGYAVLTGYSHLMKVTMRIIVWNQSDRFILQLADDRAIDKDGKHSYDKYADCCFSKRMRKLFRKNEKSVLQFCNKSSKTKRAFTKVLMPCKRPF